MEYLTSQAYTTGYPSEFIYIGLLIGVGLALLSPWRGFLFSVFFFAARNTQAAVLTRTDLLGQYLNANDLFVWIAVLSAGFYLARKKSIYLPAKPIILIFFVLFLGDIQSLVRYGVQDYVLRAIWATSIFPILFLVTTIMVDSPSKLKTLYWTFFLGNVVGAIQHVIFLSIVSQGVGSIFNGANVRSIGYMFNGGILLLMAALFFPIKVNGRAKPALYLAGVSLITFSILMHQTRQIYVNFIVSFIALTVILQKHIKAWKLFFKIGFLALVIPVAVILAFPNWDFAAILGSRVNSMIQADEFLDAANTRLHGWATEVEIWENSSVLFGIGASYPPEYTEAYRMGDVGLTDAIGALDHVVFSSHLAHYGVIGLILLVFLLPILTLKRALPFLSCLRDDYYARVFLLICITNSLMDIFGIFGSVLNTSPTSHISGIVYGILWSSIYTKHAGDMRKTTPQLA